MNNLIYCITSTNKDMLSSIKTFFVGIPNIFTMKFYERHRDGLIVLAAIIGVLIACIGFLILGIYLVDMFFPDNSTAMLWLPIASVWSVFLIFLYVAALYTKCKEL